MQVDAARKATIEKRPILVGLIMSITPLFARVVMLLSPP